MNENPANTKYLHNICTTSAQRLRRWANIVQMLYKCFVFTYCHACKDDDPLLSMVFTYKVSQPIYIATTIVVLYLFLFIFQTIKLRGELSIKNVTLTNVYIYFSPA